MPRGYREPTRRRVPVSKCGACRDPLFCEACREIEQVKKRKAGERKRKARRSVISDRFSLADVAAECGWTCWLCGAACLRPAVATRYHPDLASIDHLIPISLNGPDVLANTRIAHLRCNTSRGAKVDIERIEPMLLAGGILIDGTAERITWAWLDEVMAEGGVLESLAGTDRLESPDLSSVYTHGAPQIDRFWSVSG